MFSLKPNVFIQFLTTHRVASNVFTLNLAIYIIIFILKSGYIEPLLFSNRIFGYFFLPFFQLSFAVVRQRRKREAVITG